MRGGRGSGEVEKDNRKIRRNRIEAPLTSLNRQNRSPGSGCGGAEGALRGVGSVGGDELFGGAARHLNGALIFGRRCRFRGGTGGAPNLVVDDRNIPQRLSNLAARYIGIRESIYNRRKRFRRGIRSHLSKVDAGEWRKKRSITYT